VQEFQHVVAQLAGVGNPRVGHDQEPVRGDTERGPVRPAAAKGITYDTGFINQGTSTHERFDSELVRRDLRVIRDDLHCTAVRVTGGDVDRLEIAAKHAADLGLEVWFSPFTCDLTTDELLTCLTDCAERAERLRLTGAGVVLVAGAELSLCTIGFLPGDTLGDRIGILSPTFPRLREVMAAVPPLINDFLAKAVAVVRERFGGKVTYASIPFEGVDWTPFDFVGVDSYRTTEIAEMYPGAIRSLVAQGKPLAITEFGCATHRGAAGEGARGGMIVEWDGKANPLRLDGDYVRDEDEQATCIRELLDIYTAEDVDSVFLCTFACYHLPHREGSREDLDMASYGVVKVAEDRVGWEPKVAFGVLADYYGVSSSSAG
jgi:hypothetical protein